MSVRKRNVRTLIMAGAIFAAHAFLISGCENKGRDSEGAVGPATSTQTSAAQREAEKAADQNREAMAAYEKMTPEEARREFHRIVRIELKDDQEVQALYRKRLAVSSKQEAAEFSVAKGISGGAELVTAIDSGRAQRQSLVEAQRQLLPMTDDERTKYKKEREAIQSKITKALQQFHAFRTAHPEIGDARKQFAVEYREVDHALIQILKKRGYEPLLKAMQKKS